MNLSNGEKKAWIEPQLFWKLDLLIALLFHCQNRHLTELPFQYCYRADISTLVILRAMFKPQQQLDGHHLLHLLFHKVVLQKQTNKKIK